MNKILALIMIAAVLSVVCFSTVQLYRGNFGAAFSAAPFLLILYFFVKPKQE